LALSFSVKEAKVLTEFLRIKLWLYDAPAHAAAFPDAGVNLRLSGAAAQEDS